MDIMLEPTENARRDILPSSNGEISGRNGRDSEEDDVAGDMTNMVAPSAVGFTFFPPDGENIMGALDSLIARLEKANPWPAHGNSLRGDYLGKGTDILLHKVSSMDGLKPLAPTIEVTRQVVGKIQDIAERSIRTNL